MDKEQIIDLILDDNLTADDIIELNCRILPGLTPESILGSERDSIWDMETYDVIEAIEDQDLYETEIKYGGTIVEMVKYHLCTQIDVYEIIERDIDIYEDIIYQTLDSMTIDELMDLIMEMV